MAGFGDLVQKAFYLGVGLASYAGEKAGTTLGELRSQAQKIADEMVARGEMSAEEAKRMVDEMVNRAQQTPVDNTTPTKPAEPRRIEILDDDDVPANRAAAAPPDDGQDVERLRQQVIQMQEELRRLKRD